MFDLVQQFGEAEGCRYFGDLLDLLVELDAEKVLRVEFEADWQGFLDCDVLLKDGRVFSYFYNYGSCSGCDEWENRDLTTKEIIDEIREAATYFSTYDSYLQWRSKVEEGKDDE